jgi:hypothetical protein
MLARRISGLMSTVRMKAILIVTAFAIAGCTNGSSLLNNKSNVPQASNIPVGNSLALPPDLQLATPTQTSDAYEPNGEVITETPASPVKVKSKPKLADANIYGSDAVVPVKQDIYAQYGVSKTNDDGTPKKPEVLKAELKAAIIKKKRETNPNYGTISNIGAIFNDQ